MFYKLQFSRHDVELLYALHTQPMNWYCDDF